MEQQVARSRRESGVWAPTEACDERDARTDDDERRPPREVTWAVGPGNPVADLARRFAE